MQSNSSRRNNPVNPLFKVIALDIHKIANEGKPHVGKIYIDLSVREGSGIRGSTKLDDGSQVFISFTMSVKKLELQVIFDANDDNRKSCNLSFSEVTYAKSAGVKHGSKTQGRGKIENSGEAHAQADVKASTNLLHPLEASIGVGGSVATKRQSSSRGSRIDKVDGCNIAVAYAGNKIFWDIDVPDTDKSDDKYIEGNFFLSNSGAKRPACVITRLDKSSVAEISASAAVFVDFQNINLKNISLRNKAGEPVAAPQASGLRMLAPLFDSDKAKQSLLKEVIRKHLKREGMDADEIIVQASRAGA